MYSDNPSLLYHSGYGFNPEIAYGQYSPVTTPLASYFVDGQLYSPQQVPFSPSYYPQPSPPSLSPITSAFPMTPTELMTSESSSTDNMAFGPGSGYFVNFRSFSGADLSGNLGSSPLASPGIYPQPMGILGSYEQSVGQVRLHLTFHYCHCIMKSCCWKYILFLNILAIRLYISATFFIFTCSHMGDMLVIYHHYICYLSASLSL